MRRLVEFVLEGSWLGAVVLVPLYVDSTMDSPFAGAKYHLLLSIAWVMLGTAVAREVLGGLEPLGRFLRRPLPLIAVSLAVVSGISSMFSVVPAISFWGGERYQGHVLMLVYVMLFLVVARHVTEARRQRLFWAILFTVSTVAVGAFFSYPERAGSFLGSPMFLGSYLLIGIFLSGHLILRGRWGLIPVFPLLGFALLLTVSRASIAAMIIGGLVAMVVRWPDRWGVMVLILIALLPFMITPDYMPASLELRLEIWGNAVDLVRESTTWRRAVGYGPESFGRVVEQPPQELRGRSQVVDRAHNMPLQLVVELGVFGLMLYLLFWVELGASGPKWMVPLLVALFVESLFGIRTIAPQVTFWALAGVVGRE